jgi:tetratricopeptide (TPR) repeat protein
MCSSIRKLGLFLVLPLVFGLLFSQMIFAQARNLSGKVTDDKGQPVMGATVTILGMDSNRKYPTKTDKKGEWVYMNIASGRYRLVVRAPGFNPGGQEGITPAIGFTPVNIALTPGDPNLKLPFELTPEEQAKLKQEQEKLQARSKMAGEIKAFFEAGRDLSAKGQYPEAIAEFKKALEKFPEEPTVLANLADAQMKSGQSEEALANFEKALAVAPDDASLWTNKGVVLGKLGKTAESQEAFKKAAALNPAAAAQNFYNLGATLVNAGQAKDAAAAFRQAIAADSNYSEAYYQLGLCLSGDPTTMTEAVQMLQKYIQTGKDPNNIEVAKQLIQALKK